MSVNITVVTASMPDRAERLKHLVRSVQDQDVAPIDHLIRVEAPSLGQPNPVDVSKQRNALLDDVESEWLAVIDDDDYYYPHHFATIAPLLDTDADVIHTFCDGHFLPMADVSTWGNEVIEQKLRYSNLFASGAAIRTSKIREIGGWGGDFDFTTRRYTATNATWEDWDLWVRLARAGARFACVPTETWCYSWGDWNSSRNW